MNLSDLNLKKQTPDFLIYALENKTLHLGEELRLGFSKIRMEIFHSGKERIFRPKI